MNSLQNWLGIGNYENYPCQNPIEDITEELVKTSEGRKKYLQFLQDHPNIPPLQKLYGTKSREQPDSEEIKKHAKRLFLWIHPDKVEDKEKELCHVLFDLTNKAVELCVGSIDLP